jgi:hypothetical protein
MSSAAAELLITRKRAQLENLLNATANPEPKRTLTATLRHAGDHQNDRLSAYTGVINARSYWRRSTQNGRVDPL